MESDGEDSDQNEVFFFTERIQFKRGYRRNRDRLKSAESADNRVTTNERVYRRILCRFGVKLKKKHLPLFLIGSVLVPFQKKWGMVGIYFCFGGI
jgi:hypothetical protein